MNRTFAAAFLASVLAVALGACGDDSDDGYGYVYAGGGGGGPASCGDYTTCGACTPVEGCGWCFTNSGGTCVSDPDQCTDASEFTWTWEPSGCPSVDASVVPLDAGTVNAEASTATDSSAVTTEASPPTPEAAPDAPPEASHGD